MRRTIVLFAVIAAALCSCSLAEASPFIRYGIQDDAWLSYGPGTVSDRLDRLDALGVDVVRVTIDWREVEPARATYAWSRYDTMLAGCTSGGSRHWSRSGAPPAGRTAAAGRTGRPPRSRRSQRSRGAPRSGTRTCTSGRVERAEPTALASSHVAARLHADVAQPGVRGDPRRQPGFAGGGRRHGAARVGRRGVSGRLDPGMAAAHARLDAYAHNPYPLRPGETPLVRRLRPLHDDHDGHARPAARERGAARSAPGSGSG